MIVSSSIRRLNDSLQFTASAESPSADQLQGGPKHEVEGLRMRHEEELRKSRQEESRKRHEEELRKKKGRKKHKKAKRREGGKQSLSGPSVQHEALVIQEPSMALEQQQHKTSRLSPDPSLTRDQFADLQDAGEASAAKIQCKHVGHKAQQRKTSPSNSRLGGVLGSEQEAVTYASPPREEESIKQNDDFAILKKGYPNDAELLMGQSVLHASHSSNQSGEAQQEASFDGEETSSWLKVDKKPLSSCSGDCSDTAQDEDEHYDKKPSSVDEDEHSDKNPTLDEDECSDENPPWDEDEHSDEIGVHAIEDQREEQGSAVSYAQTQALLDMDDQTIKKKIIYCLSKLKYNGPEDHFYESLYEPQQRHELNLRLALYRIRGYNYKVCGDRKIAGMDDAALADEGYFKQYEEVLEWYFDPHLCKYGGFDDYQRLVLRNYGEYADWDRYKSTLHTYEKDLAYVQYYEAMENKTKWIENCLIDGSISWKKVENVARLQSLKVAASFPNVLPSLLCGGFDEHIWTVHADFSDYKGVDGVYFEIWKRVTKRKMDFKEALSEVYQERIFPYRSLHMEIELEKPFGIGSMKDNYNTYVACIDGSVSDDQALQLITEAVQKMSPKTKTYVDYAKKKLEIAAAIGLIKEGSRTEVAGQC